MSYNEQNVFAEILQGNIPCDKVYEDEYVLAFNDVNPKAPIHILVIPKGQYVDMTDFATNASTKEMAALWKAVGVIAEEKFITETGYRIIINTGKHGGQEVPHLHLHILGGEMIGAMRAKR